MNLPQLSWLSVRNMPKHIGMMCLSASYVINDTSCPPVSVMRWQESTVATLVNFVCDCIVAEGAT